MASDTTHDDESNSGATKGAPDQPTENSPQPETLNPPGESVIEAGREDSSAEPVHEQLEDADLLEMLEQLSETIDTAQTVLTEQHQQAAGTDPDGPPLLPGDPGHGSVAHVHEPPPLTSAVAPHKSRGAVWILALCSGAVLSIGALAAMWLFWNAPDTGSGLRISKDQSRVRETVILRSSAASTPEPDQIDTAEKEQVRKDLMKLTPPGSNSVQSEPLQNVAKQVAPDPEPAPPAPIPAPLEKQSAEVRAAQQVALAEPRSDDSGAGMREDAQLPPLGQEEIEQILLRGKIFSETGDISAARLVFEYAARRRSADAMFALGETYDPARLESWNVIGIKPDLNAALVWYSRAAELGHDAADARADELEKLLNR